MGQVHVRPEPHEPYCDPESSLVPVSWSVPKSWPSPASWIMLTCELYPEIGHVLTWQTASYSSVSHKPPPLCAVVRVRAYNPHAIEPFPEPMGQTLNA
jgi:hypothetical protein